MRIWICTCLALVAVAPVAHAQDSTPLVTDGLSLYLSFDSVDEDGVWLDNSGNGLNGLTTEGFEDANDDGLPDIRLDTSEKFRGAGSALFDTDPAIQEDYIAICDRVNQEDATGDICDLAIDSELIPETGISIAAWMKVQDVGADHSIWQSRAEGGGFIHTQINGGGNARMRLRGDLNSDNIVAYNEPPGGEAIEFDEWVHWAGTYERLDDEDIGTWAFYYNGEEVAGGDANGDVAGTEAEFLGNWEQGAFIGMVPDFNRQLVGNIDEFYLFNRKITAEEVQRLYDPTLPCDLNADDVCDFGDLRVIEDDIAAGNSTPADALAFLTAEPDEGLGTILGDVTLDGKFNPDDLIEIFAAGKYNIDEQAYYDQGDYNFDGKFNPDDLIEAFASGNYDATGPATAAVPEPTGLALLVLGGLGLMARRRR